MPRTAEDVENYLLKLDRHFENDGGTFLVQGPGETTIAIRVAPPIVAIRVAIGQVPADAASQIKVFRRLLEYNATDLMHISYGVDANGNGIVLSSALELENLDLNELEATLSDVDLALAQHLPQLVHAATGK